MGAAHTPWTVDLTDFGIMDSMTTYVGIDDGDATIARVMANRPGWRDRARLIAAAPDLLEALECAPIVAAGESLAEFRSRQDAWLNGKYRAAISRALPGGEGK